MERLGFKSLIIIALALGGVFEIAKRSSWTTTPQIKDVADPTELTPSRPYARRTLELGHSRQSARQTRAVTTPRKATLSQRALYIPPTEGQFDSNVGNKVANQKQKPQTLVKKSAADKWKAWDKKRRYDHERHCFRKHTEEEKAELEALEAQEPKLKTIANIPVKQQKPEQEEDDKIGECPDEKVADKTEENDELDTDEQPDSEYSTPGSTTISGGILTVRNEGDELDGLEEWKERLLNQPNFKETVRLIELAQSGQISSALFYKLVELMITDPRPAIQELGILAAGRTPSYESFHMLIRLVKSENFGTKLRARAEAELNAYEQPRFLPLLERVLKSSNDFFAVIWATKQLEESARTYLTAKYVKPATPPGPLAGKNPYVSTFQRFVLVLQDLSRAGAGNHPEETSQARTTLAKIQELLRSFS